MSKGEFVLKQRTRISQIDETTRIPESDLCFQDGDFIVQMEYREVDSSRELTKVKPGAFVLADTPSGIALISTDITPRRILPSLVSTKIIRDEISAFFDNLHVYEELELPMARKILLHSQPGVGKTTTTFAFCHEEIQKNNGAVVLLWPTATVKTSSVLEFLDNEVEYTPDVSKVIIIMEDIGGGGREGSYSPRGTDASLLEFLDGGRNVFKKPTFVVATTNYPENMARELADRPGRFDNIIKVPCPTPEERVNYAEFVNKGPLSEDDKKAISDRKLDDFSLAHVKEVVTRSRVHKKPFKVAIDELLKHKENFKKEFNEDKSGGLGWR